jgi:hypothetical protein
LVLVGFAVELPAPELFELREDEEEEEEDNEVDDVVTVADDVVTAAVPFFAPAELISVATDDPLVAVTELPAIVLLDTAPAPALGALVATLPDPLASTPLILSSPTACNWM